MRILEMEEKDKKNIFFALEMIRAALKPYNESHFDSFIGGLEKDGKKYNMRLTYTEQEIEEENGAG